MMMCSTLNFIECFEINVNARPSLVTNTLWYFYFHFIEMKLQKNILIFFKMFLLS